MPSPPPPDPLLGRLAERLRAIREQERMSLTTLSLRADVGIELIRELEHAGGHVPKVATVIRLAGASASGRATWSPGSAGCRSRS